MTERFADSTVPDLAAAGAGSAASKSGGQASQTASGNAFVVDVDGPDAFKDLVERSASVPVVIDLWATWCEPCKQLSPILEALAAEYGGRVLLAKIDVEKNQEIAAAFQVQSVPNNDD